MTERDSQSTRDIVWCLRANADDCEQSDESYSGAASQAALDREAAEEIERLRTELAEAEAALEKLING